MLKIGVLGAGHLGKIHINCIKQIDNYDLVGFYDPAKETALQVEEEMRIKNFDSVDALIEAVDVVDIVTPTIRHFECASKALQKRKHVFIEKPIVATPEEANALKKLADEAGVKVQVGHVERFNPAFIAAEPFIEEPLFIEVHRLAQFNPRGTDVPVVLDLMVHDLDILLTIVKSPIAHISASGVGIVSPSPDITNVRIEFENGTVANLTASRMSMKYMRKTRIFQKGAYITISLTRSPKSSASTTRWTRPTRFRQHSPWATAPKNKSPSKGPKSIQSMPSRRNWRASTTLSSTTLHPPSPSTTASTCLSSPIASSTPSTNPSRR